MTYEALSFQSLSRCCTVVSLNIRYFGNFTLIVLTFEFCSTNPNAYLNPEQVELDRSLVLGQSSHLTKIDFGDFTNPNLSFEKAQQVQL